MTELTLDFARTLPARYRVREGSAFTLDSYPTRDHGDLDKKQVRKWVRQRRAHLGALQERIAAEHRHALLVVLQGMDGAGKDSLILNVMTGMNPQGTRVVSFKKPSEIEQAHDYLWRVHMAVPARGQVGVFNRSHYEDVLVARVHADRLDTAGMQGNPETEAFWDGRLTDIRNFESYLSRQGIHTFKIMLHMSPECQQKRLLRRLRRPDKRWKFDESDLAERQFWPAYQQAYQEAIRATSCKHAPWLVVPSDKKWYARLVVMEALIERLEGLSPEPPPASPEILRNLDRLEARIKASRIGS
ncbi:PPK2 family polyphosphate kinase [Swaminathania salitolerans]|uniref:PPK2 family polyphosphate kinase n=1 Tax=Swaminathania salitolerans TaxID=182838 RepID=UPI001649C651|nr:PPK2 family polyphosphate kinase [Swaminathania salitolerans]